MLFSLKFLKDKYGFIPRGIIHLGAHIGQEAEDYVAVKRVLWVEGNPDLMGKLNDQIKRFEGNLSCQALLGDKDDEEVDFNIANSDGQSSSIFSLNKMKKLFKDIEVIKTTKMKTKRLDTLMGERALKSGDYDFLAVDLQGAEIKAIEGMGSVLNDIQWLCIEINLVKLYHHTPLLHTVDLYLARKGFKRVETDFRPRQWGDALYHREHLKVWELILILLKDYLIEIKINFLLRLRFLRFLDPRKKHI